MDYNKWLEKVETPITRDDKYLYQLIIRIDRVIELLEQRQTHDFVKPIGTKDEPNEDVTEEFIHFGNVDEKLGDTMYDEEEEAHYEYNNMTVKELREIAKDNGLTGYSNMKKEELIDLIISEV